MLASNPTVKTGFSDRMNGLDFFFSPSSTGNTAEDDDWGDFVDSSPRIDSPSRNQNGFLADRNGANPTPNRIESEKKNQAQWVNSRGPVPLSVFGEEEEEDESGAAVSSFNLSFDSFSSKHNDGTGSVSRVAKSNPNIEISGLIANLYRENGHNEISDGRNLPENNSPESSPSRKIENSAARWEKLSWNPLNIDTETSESASNAVNSGNIGVNLDPNYSDLRVSENNDDDVDYDGWEFKTAESMFRSKDEQESAKSGSVMVHDELSSDRNGTGPSFDEVISVSDGENGDEDDLWGNGGWEFKVAEAVEPKKDITNKESNGFESDSNIETKEPQKRENGLLSIPSNGNVNSEGTSWAFNQSSLDKEVHTEKAKGVLPLSFFEDEELETSDTLGHEENPDSICDFSVREKTKAPNPAVSINDLISSLYSQVDENNSVNRSEKTEFVSVKATTESSLVNGEDDSWVFQGPTETITNSSVAERADDIDSTWEFQGPSLASKISHVTEGVDDFDGDSWEFQGPTQPVKDKRSSMENEVWNQSSVPNGFGESQEKPVISIEPNDYEDIFQKLKTELYYIALDHLESLKEARDLAADSDEVQKCDSEIQELQNLLNNDVLISEVNVESLQPRSSGGISELSKALQEPKFRAIDSEELLSERLSLAEKDWKTTIELLKHAMSTLKILNTLCSPEQQSKYVSTWFVIAWACAQELGHAASIWKQVVQNDVQEEILSKPQGKSYFLSVGEIYRVVKILRASTRLYRPWILVAPTSSNVLAVLDDCVKLWLSSGLEEALPNIINGHDDQLLESIKYIEDVDDFNSASSPTCYISGLNSQIVPGLKMVEWNGDHYFVSLANLWANLISREPPSLPGHRF